MLGKRTFKVRPFLLNCNWACHILAPNAASPYDVAAFILSLKGICISAIGHKFTLPSFGSFVHNLKRVLCLRNAKIHPFYCIIEYGTAITENNVN